ncbi:M61 family metallopeptidase [Spirosoma validum]|uniref:M61 family metallopeptidase n=1 Tax=Spirosoma validum TaxID=2771355 RepID=A0A927GFY2_9BACT|nr:M61 family metallopeptidase [Spirosoma validum]MBD2756427.1 M61 family metallopeptidase [Spirosoma validum]
MSRRFYQITGFTTYCCLVFVSGFLSISTQLFAQKTAEVMAFDVTMNQPANHLFHVTLHYVNKGSEAIDFKLPAWTPGYYQLMNYASNVENFQATDKAGKALKWEKTGNNTWRVNTNKASELKLLYDVKATRNFVAGNYLDENRGYISPAGVFMHVANQIQQPATVTLHPYSGWKSTIATGLDSIPGQSNTFTAPNFDVLYDSPMLMGNLDQLPSFTVNGIPHYFVGYNIGKFDQQQFVSDLKKIVEAGAAVIGDIPYKHYTFIAIGPGGGGIEHLNSTSISFDGNGLNTPQGKLRLYKFLAHEYFHHYNVKRIRPVSLGPFDYDRENRTNMLWVSEGFTVYYEYLILRRAGLMTDDELLNALRTNLSAYENKPGHLFQSATQASYETWEDGPFGRTGDDAYKTISYYEKGPVLGMLLDFKIRHETKNKKSLDDVMQTLYQEYYQKKNRGFTDQEFRQVSEKTAGTSLIEVFDYASTVKPIDYPKYLAYAGLAVDTTFKQVSKAWLGLAVREKSDSVYVSDVDWESPAWKAGVRSGSVVLKLNDQPATVSALKSLNPDVPVKLVVAQRGQVTEKSITPGKKSERSFQITRLPNPDKLQNAILTDWLRN